MQIDWQAISGAIAQGIIPAPSGSNENGEPFWLINNQKVTWQQVQAFITQAKQAQAAAATASSGGGIESFPQMPSTPNFEVADKGFETRVEKAPERAAEKKEPSPEAESAQAQQPQAATPTQPPKHKGESLIGQSAPLQTVDTSDPKSMLDFVTSNKTAPADSSNKFLAEFLEKILQVLSIDVK